LDQSFSWYHADFFFLTETEKKLSSEISALKTKLDPCRAEIEAERQTHQREERALRAQVIEAEERRDVVV
jgi:predicted  nucleic acid-binding Zn-ribbon protein